MSVKYEYLMVEIDTHTMAPRKNSDNAAANYLQKIVNQHSQQGWEFYRMDLFGVSYTPNWGTALSAISGSPDNGRVAYVITFRKVV
jgi:hypothetical protein